MYMGKYIDLTGQEFGYWKVLNYDMASKGKGPARWICKCTKCNKTIKSVDGSHLRRGSSTSCGCDMRKIDLIGQTFGELTVLERDNTIKNKKVNYLCQCSCGRKTIIAYGNLTSGNSTTCGQCSNDLIGKKFGKLTILERDYDYPIKNNLKGKDAFWKCRCECGNFHIASTSNLRSGNIKSCGCISKGVSPKFLTELNQARYHNILGQRFGKLTVLEKTKKRASNGSVIWKCLCDCGNECEKSVDSLLSGTSSCGCLVSKGEAKIIAILQAENIKVEQQKTFDDLKSDYGWPYKYDFYLPEYNRLIEFDGIQHFEYKDFGWNTKEHFLKIKQSDQIKNEYAKFNNIDLVRIPYFELNNLNINMLLGNKYLI